MVVGAGLYMYDVVVKKFTFAISSPDGLLPAALRAAQTCRYLVYSEADFEVFRPAGATRCTDGDEIWHGVTPSVQRQGCRTPKIEIFTKI